MQLAIISEKQQTLELLVTNWYIHLGSNSRATKNMVKEKDFEAKVSIPYDTDVKASKARRRRMCRLGCCMGVGVIFLIGILIIILVFTVFKARDPDIWVNGVKLADLNITYGTLVPHVRLRLDLSLTVHNPNKANYKYDNGSSILYYQDIEVGHADIPAGRLSAKETKTQSVTLNVQADQFLRGSNITKDFVAGVIPVSATTKISGRVNILNIYKRHGVSYSWCNMSVFIANATLASLQCRYTLHG
ncbi:hypothetical protein M758_4G128400 [Ceratodon purpureus]|nr:hypothetical protein M758_4G128400 [Ceratodon purpureus]KAG0619283.1 hypothetical protein M758_4G128400 [Ceratodon purpureus]